MEQWRGYIWGVLFALTLLTWSTWQYLAEVSALKVTFFDVGQGDAIFIETPQGHQILIDGGPKKGIVAEKIANNLPFWDRDLDLVILTHTDADHITGLVRILEQFEVDSVLWNGKTRSTNIFGEWEGLLTDVEDVWLAQAPQQLRFGQQGLYMDILFPTKVDVVNTDDPNDVSIVSRLTYGQYAFLFTGDIEKSVEQKLVQRGLPLKAQVLKVPHHGSKTSTSELFLSAVSPSLAVIQAGRNNRYGHPAPEVVERIQNIGVPTLRNDQNGDIVIQSNGESLEITNK